ncbi:MAG: TPM domain-containing protein, partial [Thiovulaceae bacterium]|nr:TPM domain-containing protein [Sulfurimonadaceae bacterium]
LLLMLLGRFDRLTMALVPPSVKRIRAANAARRHFMALLLHTTKKRSALMLFVSEDEHYVEILTDIEVAREIPDSEWEAIVQSFISRVKEGETAQGYLEAIERSGELLILHFPYDPEETDELPNHLIML